MTTHTTPQTKTPANYYSATRNQGNIHKGRWTGWVQFRGEGSVTETPDTYATKREALAAIKAQHP